MRRIRIVAIALSILPLTACRENDDTRAQWVTSTSCRTCHESQHESWSRTFHRTMTQEATPDAVLGAFDGRTVEFFGVRARPIRRGDSFFVDYLDENDRPTNSLRIVRTVGSRRYQQYLAAPPESENDPNLYRIPLVWHIDENRWGHMNGVFLEPDGLSYDHHVTIWNQNCIFCHNTGPVPGLANAAELSARARSGEPVRFDWDGRYESSVAELGIACEACHSPGGAHEEIYGSALRRFVRRIWPGDPAIVDPEELSPERSVQVCGQCHGQRLPNPSELVMEFLTKGPRYRSGEDLLASVLPITIETPFPGDPQDTFRARFWKDGTPRLTAYEYQGLVASECHVQGGLTCIDCHSMHGGDPRGQLEPVMRTNAACASCHAEIVANTAAHTHHDAESSGSSCYECHMPRIVYGVLEIHRSHRIEVPSPAANARDDRPDACTSCHWDRSTAWAVEQTDAWWPREDGPEEHGAADETAAFAEALFGGDPVERAVAARLAAEPDAPESAGERAFLTPFLIAALEDDYPAVRRLAWRSLRALGVSTFQEFDPLAAPDVRRRVVRRLMDQWRSEPKGTTPEGLREFFGPNSEWNERAVAARRAAQRNPDIRIGE